MAFQPFVEAGTARIFGYEALVRGINEFLASKGIRLFQGYFFARPGFRSLPPISQPGLEALLARGHS